MDAILTLGLLYERRLEFNQPLCVAYVDLKAAFDSVDRQTLAGHERHWSPTILTQSGKGPPLLKAAALECSSVANTLRVRQ